MENWTPGRFTHFIDDVIERQSAPKTVEQFFERFNDLLLETAWAVRSIAELDERLAARVYGLVLDVILEEMKIRG
jgi:hypothetical protein